MQISKQILISSTEPHPTNELRVASAVTKSLGDECWNTTEAVSFQTKSWASWGILHETSQSNHTTVIKPFTLTADFCSPPVGGKCCLATLFFSFLFEATTTCDDFFHFRRRAHPWYDSNEMIQCFTVRSQNTYSLGYNSRLFYDATGGELNNPTILSLKIFSKT